MNKHSTSPQPIHIVHVVYSFATGGLENGVVNLINNLPEKDYRHSIVCITGHDKDFIKRITGNNARYYDLNKKPGKGLSWLFAFWRILRTLKPDIVHSRNLNALEAQFIAFLAGISYRIHGEHGWDVNDLGGTNEKYQKIRRILKPLISQYVALSNEAVAYLKDKISVNPQKINHICNGVDTTLFAPNKNRKHLPTGFADDTSIVFGTVGRLAEVKNQAFLLRAFLRLWQHNPQLKLRLVIVGDGILADLLKEMVAGANAGSAVFFAGNRSDVNTLLQQMDVFVLPSLAEGVSNTILEAMATGLPVIATKVGGNSDLILTELQNSHLVEVNNDQQLILAMQQYLDAPEYISKNSKLIREHCVKNFSLVSMVNRYQEIYQNNNKGLL
ncbi:glycosyl transferase family 1 [Thalassotalea sp. 42_200_T64]|nr:glycosyl transferase family 1 [Thalassotalea sp. 42_200_T64]